VLRANWTTFGALPDALAELAAADPDGGRFVFDPGGLAIRSGAEGAGCSTLRPNWRRSAAGATEREEPAPSRSSQTTPESRISRTAPRAASSRPSTCSSETA